MTARRLTVDEVFEAAVDSLAEEAYDVEAGWLRFRAWMIERGYAVPDDGPVSGGDGEEAVS